MYSDNSKKFVVVLNKKHDISKLMNAMGHVSAGLSSKVGNDQADYLEYKCPAGGFVSAISRYPFIVLSAPNSSQLSKLVALCAENGIEANTFVSAMLGASAEEQLAATQIASVEDLDYMAVAMFGDAQLIDPLTRKFSLWR